jgi:hypothetical protein
MTVRFSAAVPALALACVACDTPPPPVAPPRSTTALDGDDLAVMRGVLDSLGRPHFLVVDATIGFCPVHPPRTSATPRADCLSDDWLGNVSRLLPSEMSLTGLRAFDQRNRARLPLTAPLGSDVTFISATVIDFLSSTDLLARYPSGSAVVTFGAPFYSAPGLAVIAYGLHQDPDVVAAAKLERGADGRWVVAEQSGAVER